MPQLSGTQPVRHVKAQPYKQQHTPKPLTHPNLKQTMVLKPTSGFRNLPKSGSSKQLPCNTRQQQEHYAFIFEFLAWWQAILVTQLGSSKGFIQFFCRNPIQGVNIVRLFGRPRVRNRCQEWIRRRGSQALGSGSGRTATHSAVADLPADKADNTLNCRVVVEACSLCFSGFRVQRSLYDGTVQ